VGQNTIGWVAPENSFKRTRQPMPLFYNKNFAWPFSSAGNTDPGTYQTYSYLFNTLMIYLNGPYGYPSWKQIRAGQNPLTRKQNLHNVFTYVEEPGPSNNYKIRGKNFSNTNRYGSVKVFTEPVVSDPSKPLTLLGGISVYDERTNAYELKTVQMQTTFGNETLFFANDEINRSYGTIEETDENYENFKDLYLNGGLEADGSPIDEFSLMVYRQTVWPKVVNAFLNRTRSRTYFVNKFWREDRSLRTRSSASCFGTIICNQSIWPLDVRGNFAVTGSPVIESLTAVGNDYVIVAYPLGGTNTGTYNSVSNWLQWNTGNRSNRAHSSFANFGSSSYQGGAGILQNNYSHLSNGLWINLELEAQAPTYVGAAPFSYLTASCFYSRLHTLNTMTSLVSPSGMNIAEITPGEMIDTGSYWAGQANWDAGRQAGKMPFFDSYDDFAHDTRIKGKDYSIIPEFRISSHVDFYQRNGVVQELPSIFELSGALSENTTTDGTGSFYTIISNSDFMKHFEMIKEDHEDFAKPAIITLKCTAIKKFLPYEGFYPAQRTAQMAEQFYQSHKDNIAVGNISGASWPGATTASFGLQPLLEPLFAPGVLFNSIKAGLACDYPVIAKEDGIISSSANMWGYPIGLKNNFAIYGSDLGGASGSNLSSIFSKRIPFEALIDPALYMAYRNFVNQDPNRLGLSLFNFSSVWSGGGDKLYSKMASNFLAEVPEFFLKDQNFTTISSLESSNPEFGNAISGNFYAMRVKMHRSRNKPNDFFMGWNDVPTTPPQDLFPRTGVRETFTMYSRPSAFGPPLAGGQITSGSVCNNDGISPMGRYNVWDSGDSTYFYPPLDSRNGFNFPFTPPYYHGDAWCDLIFECHETKKYTISEILLEVARFPYYTRYNWHKGNSVLRDLAGGAQGHIPGQYQSYGDSPWARLILDPLNGWTFLAPNTQPTSTEPIPISGSQSSSVPIGHNYYGQQIWYWAQPGETSTTTQLRFEPSMANGGEYVATSPMQINYNAMQLNSSLNLFGKAQQQKVDLTDDETSSRMEVYTEATQEAKARWTIQTKFETPMLNFNKYTNLDENNCTKPQYASESVSRGIWHQYGEIPENPAIGVFLEVTDIPTSWYRGQLRISDEVVKRKVKSLADLVGFDKGRKRLGECAAVKQISEAVVAVPFTVKDSTRQFFAIPREDIDGAIGNLERASRTDLDRERGGWAAGSSVVELVKKMSRYVFPPSMDFVKYNAIDPFAMYVFEFTHNLSTQDLADIWQNLPPTIGTEMTTCEATISHSLLAEELMGGGTVQRAGNILRNAPGNEIPSNIQWMIFKVKKRAHGDYYEKVVLNTGKSPKPGWVRNKEQKIHADLRAAGKDPEITYNWPYDFFSLVELVKLDAEITFADLEDTAGKPRVIKPKTSGRVAQRRGATAGNLSRTQNRIAIARGIKK